MEFTVLLTPKASANKIGDWVCLADGTMALRVYVTAAPVKGQANQALIQLLAKTCRIAKSELAIVRGELGRTKTIAAPDNLPLPTQKIG